MAKEKSFGVVHVMLPAKEVDVPLECRECCDGVLGGKDVSLLQVEAKLFRSTFESRV